MKNQLLKMNITRTLLAQWDLQIRLPNAKGIRQIILLLHGWTGDENSMWIFASRLPEDAILIAPRGLHTTPLGGFSWHPIAAQSFSVFTDFMPAVKALDELMDPANFYLDSITAENLSNISIVGFSQGAALAYSFGLKCPNKVGSLAGLSGFFPDGADDLVAGQPLNRNSVFIAHGTRDSIVPVERARKSVEMMQLAGGDVTYCEDDVGHKLGTSCFRGLRLFFAR